MRKKNDYTEMKWLFDKIKEVIDEILSSYEDIFDHELLHRTKGIISEVIEKLLLKKAPIVKNAKSFNFAFQKQMIYLVSGERMGMMEKV